MEESTVKIAVFCSGSGSNAQKIFEYFKGRTDVEVVVVMSNNKNAFALERAATFNIPTRLFSREEFSKSETIVKELKAMKVDWVVLAGFLWLIPLNLIKAYPNKIINIHPALLPSYGGKGMYGMYVHNAVIEAKEKQTGITIHFVDENYDEGQIVFQTACEVEDCDTPELVAKKVQVLEHAHFARVIDELIKENK